MLFKKLLISTVVLLISALVISCANDYDFEEESINIRLSFDTNCIDLIEPFFKNYIEEKSTESEITNSIQCMSEAVDYVKFRVTGSRKDRYELEELRGFFNQFVFKNEPKNKEFFKSVLNIKKEIVGGSDQYLTFAELSSIQEILSILKPTLIEMNGFVKELISKESYNSKEEIELVVFSVFGFLEKVLSFDLKTFSISNIMTNMRSLADIDSSVDDWLELFNLFRGKQRTDFLVLESELQETLSLLSDYYSSYFNILFDMNNNWSSDRSTFNSLSIEIKSGIELLKRSVSLNDKSVWLKSDLVYIFDFLKDRYMENISDETLSHLIDVLFLKWFPSDTPEAQLSLVNLELLLKDFDKMLFFLSESKGIEGFVGKEFPIYESESQLLNQFLELSWPSMFTTEKSFVVDVVPLDSVFNFESLFNWSWSFTLSKVFERAYAKDFRGMSMEQVSEAYLDVFPLLLDLDIMGEESRSSWFRIFNEGDLLVPSARPNGFVSNSEMSEYFSYMISAYFSGVEASEKTEVYCPDLSKECFFKTMLDPEVELFRTLPSLNNFLGSDIEPENFVLWSESMEYIAKLDVNEDNYNSNMFFRAAVGNQYVEVLFRKYDLDKSGTFNFDETEKAYDDFKFALRLLPQVRGTIAEDSDFFLKAFFTYFVDRGRLPEFNNGFPESSFWSYMLFCGFFEANSCSFESDRSSILAILAYLTSVDLTD